MLISLGLPYALIQILICYLLFWISTIVIFDIQNNYFGYQKLCQKGILFEISKKGILDIKNNNFGYPKINIYFGY